MTRTKIQGLSLGLGLALLTMGQPVLAAPIPLQATDAGQALMGDPEHGKQIFLRCMACHTTDDGVNKIGPSLHGIIGRTAGTVANFAYSPANKKSGIVWSEQEIYDYLKNPQAKVPGTKMAFPGLPKGQDRADVIAYLEQNTK